MKINISRESAAPITLNVKTLIKDKLGARPTIFVLPGGPGAALKAYEKYECLSADFDLVFHDPRGCGESDRADSTTYTMNNYIDDVEDIRRALGLNQIIVLGKSYGAMCALGYALRYPHALEKLILSAGAPSYHFLAKARENIYRVGTKEQIDVFEQIMQGGFNSREEVKRYFELTNSLYSVKARSQSEQFDLERKSALFSYEVLNEGFRNEFWQFDFEADLHRVACPTLVLAGEEDWITDPFYSVVMAEQIPNSRLRIFHQASHAMESDVPDAYFKTITDFLNGVM